MQHLLLHIVLYLAVLNRVKEIMKKTVAAAILLLFSAHQSYGMDSIKECFGCKRRKTTIEENKASSFAQYASQMLAIKNKYQTNLRTIIGEKLDQAPWDIIDIIIAYIPDNRESAYYVQGRLLIKSNTSFQKLTNAELKIFEAVFRALQHYKIDPTLFTVIMSKKEKNQCDGYYCSDDMVICIDETLTQEENENALEYVAHHEAGHAADQEFQAIHDDTYFKIFGNLCITFNNKKVLKYFRDGELRADNFAIEHLITQDDPFPIGYVIAVKLENIAGNEERCDKTHPTYVEEYANLAAWFYKHGYQITFDHRKLENKKLKTIIEIAKGPCCLTSIQYTGKDKLIPPPVPLFTSKFKFQKSQISTEMKEAPNTGSQRSCLPMLVGMFIGGKSQ